MKIEKKRRVVITGLGTVNPTGNTVAVYPVCRGRR